MFFGLAVPVTHAAEIAVIGAHDEGLDVEANAALATALTAAIDLLPDHDALDVSEVERRIRGREEFIVSQTMAATAQQRLADGRILYQQAQPDEAALMVSSALRELTQAVRYTRSVRELWDAHLLMASIEAARGRQSEAEVALSAAASLQPTRQPDPATVPPHIIQLYNDVRTKNAAQLTELSWASVPSEARVWLDGVELDARWTSVGRGTHHVHVRTDDGLVGYQQVEVTSSERVEIAIRLEAPRLGEPASSSSGRSAQVTSLYAALGRLSGVDLVLIVGTDDQDQAGVQLYAPSVGAFGPATPVSSLVDVAAVVESTRTVMDGLMPDGQLDPGRATFVPMALDIGANPLLSAMLLTPADTLSEAPAIGLEVARDDPPREPKRPPSKDVSTKPKWPIYVGVGAGVAVVGGVTALAVALGGKGRGGTVVFGEAP